jgi:hypothetical protein
MATIQELITDGNLKCQPTGPERATVCIPQFDVSTGKRLDDAVHNLSIAELETQLAADDLAIEQATAKRQNTADLLAHVRPLIEAENDRRQAEFAEAAAREAEAKAAADAEAAKPVHTKHGNKPMPVE